MNIYIVNTLMLGMHGFHRRLDAESFLSSLPSREKPLAELTEVTVFDGPIAAQEHTRDKVISTPHPNRRDN